jgi:hypothetical protein
VRAVAIAFSGVTAGLVVWVIYFGYRIAVTVGAWPFG